MPSGGYRGPGPAPVTRPPGRTASIAHAPTAGIGAARRPAGPADGASRPAGDGPLGRRDRPPRRRRPAGRRSARRALGLTAVAIAAAGGTAAGLLISQAGTPSTMVRQLANSPSKPASALYSALGRAEEFTGQLRMSSCTQNSATLVQCTDPDPAIASVTFATYPSMSALYTKYQEIIDNLTKSSFGSVENVNVCGSLAPAPTAENTWNHSDKFSTSYTIDQMAAGKVPTDAAMGRVFCEQTPAGREYVVWTQDSGRLLGYATGAASHEQVWNWFVAVHHNITFPGMTAMTTPPASGAGPGSGGAKTPG